MARYEFPQNPSDGKTATNDVTGVTYTYDGTNGYWYVSGTSATDGFVTSGELDAEEANRILGDEALDGRITSLEDAPGGDNPALPYQLTVGERDSVTGEDVSALQILETIALKDALGNNLGDVAFESAGGLGIAIDNSYSYPVITFQTSSLQSSIKLNKGRIVAEELRSAVVPRTYNIVNRTGVPTARQGELSLDKVKVNEITMISFGETSEEGLPIGNVSVGDKLCIENTEQHRKYFYSITGGTTNGGIYGVSFIEEGSWSPTASIQEKPHTLEIFPRATPFGSNVDLSNYYSKSEIDAKFAAGLMPGDVDASDYWTKDEVATALESVRAGLQTNIDITNDLIVPPGQSHPETYYGDYAPAGNLLNGDLWFDAMNLRLNVWSQGAWINPDRNDGATLENRISALEARIAQLEGN
jgi:hypothetical protein